MNEESHMEAAGDLGVHYDAIVDQLSRGGVTPFLGAGVNLLLRPPSPPWEWSPEQDEYLPSGLELAQHLATTFRFPSAETPELVRVAQYAVALRGEEPLYEELRRLFDRNYAPNALHRFLARLPGTLRAKRYPKPYQAIVTTNYDDLLERAFVEEGEEFELIFYRAEGSRPGVFVHRRPSGEESEITSANDYDPTLLAKRTTIIKIHGAVDREDPNGDSYVISEDDYINFLAHNDLSNLVPRALKARMVSGSFLFLGYSLRDWNLRAFLHRLWRDRRRPARSWAIQRTVDDLERFSWEKNDVRILRARLEDAVEEFQRRVDALPQAPPSLSTAAPTP